MCFSTELSGQGDLDAEDTVSHLGKTEEGIRTHLEWSNGWLCRLSPSFYDLILFGWNQAEAMPIYGNFLSF